MKNKKLLVFITIIVNILLILNSTAVFAIAPKKTAIKYNETSVIISNIMEIMALIVLISYIIFLIIYLIKSKKEKMEKIKKAIKWLIILMIVAVGLWFGSEEVKKIGMTYEYWSPSIYRFLVR